MFILQIMILVYGCFYLFSVVNAARILAILPIPSKSHYLFFEGVMRSLHDAGHQITIITPFFNEESLKNYTVISSNPNEIFIGQTPIGLFKNMSGFELIQFSVLYDESYCHNVLNLKEVQEILKSNEKKYDLMFLELLFMFECYLPLAEKLDVPVIGLVSFRSFKVANPSIWYGYNPTIGNPHHPAISRFEFMQSTNALTFWQRLINTLYSVRSDLFRYLVLRSKVKNFYRQYYPAHLWDKKKVSLVFYNSHHTFVSRPLVANAIEIAGIHLNPANPLPKDIEKFIDEAEHGVILFSLGSVLPASSMSPQMLNAFKYAFAAIPQRVIWKYEENIENLSDNVLRMEWIPQRDILAHKNVKAFITHCGISSVYEAVYEGKPMVLTPIFADQFTNAAILLEHGVGVYVDTDSLTNETILEALNDVINDTKYRDRMEDFSLRFKDWPMTQQEYVVYWTEYVIKYKGTPHLRSTATDMPLHQYLLLDVIIFITVFLCTLIYSICFILRKLFVSCLYKKKSLPDVKKKTR